MTPYEKFKATLSFAPAQCWGNFHPSKYAAVSTYYAKQPNQQVFNLWLWQNQFKHPSECPSDSSGLACQDWLVAEKFAELLHKDEYVGVQAVTLTPDEFKVYIKGFNQKVSFLNSTFSLRKTNAATRAKVLS